jgi:hypothetical protein
MEYNDTMMLSLAQPFYPQENAIAAQTIQILIDEDTRHNSIKHFHQQLGGY